MVIDPKLKIPTNITYNIGIQRELRGSLTAELNYVGGHGTHGLREIDGAPPQPNLIAADIAAGVDPAALAFNSLYLGGTDKNGVDFDPAVNNTALLPYRSLSA